MRQPVITLTDKYLDPAALDTLLSVPPEAGATSSFTGYVRKANGLTALELLHHPVMTLAALETIASTAMRRFDILGLFVAHRFGRMVVGEPIVHIAAVSSHRRSALDAVGYTIDVLKTQAPFWKREWHGNTYKWIEPVSDDHEKAAQWLENRT